jgi:hypothetical protein
LCSTFESVVAVFEVAGLFCLLRQVLASSSDTPVRLRRASSDCFCSVFNVFLLLLGTASLFCVFLASFEAPKKFQRVSNEVLAKFFCFSSICFPAELIG